MTKHKIKKTTLWQIATLIFAVLFLAALLTKGFSFSAKDVPMQDAAKKGIDYLNNYMLAGSGQTAELKFIKSEGELYVMNLTIADKEYKSYITKDGKLLFPSMIELDNIPETPEQEQPEEVPKTDKPEVELFVMSHCPFGTQIEKGVIPVMELLGDKADIKIKFVYYAMHGEKELDEQLAQYCIQEEQNDNFLSYLKCFLKEGKSEECLAEAAVDTTKLEACVKTTDETYKVKENFADKTTWLNGRFPLFDIHKEDNTKYSVGGSPTVVVNGKTLSSGRDSASLLTTICSGFTTEPEECGQELLSESPSPGFGYETTGGSAEGECS